MVTEGSGRASLRARFARVFPVEPYLGRFFTLLFWAYFGATYVSYLLDGQEYGVVTITLAFAGLLICWLLLQGSGSRRDSSPSRSQTQCSCSDSGEGWPAPWP
jgi:hypothetical protein